MKKLLLVYVGAVFSLQAIAPDQVPMMPDEHAAIVDEMQNHEAERYALIRKTDQYQELATTVTNEVDRLASDTTQPLGKRVVQMFDLVSGVIENQSLIEDIKIPLSFDAIEHVRVQLAGFADQAVAAAHEELATNSSDAQRIDGLLMMFDQLRQSSEDLQPTKAWFGQCKRAVSELRQTRSEYTDIPTMPSSLVDGTPGEPGTPAAPAAPAQPNADGLVDNRFKTERDWLIGTVSVLGFAGVCLAVYQGGKWWNKSHGKGSGGTYQEVGDGSSIVSVENSKVGSDRAPLTEEEAAGRWHSFGNGLLQRPGKTLYAVMKAKKASTKSDEAVKAAKRAEKEAKTERRDAGRALGQPVSSSSSSSSSDFEGDSDESPRSLTGREGAKSADHLSQLPVPAVAEGGSTLRRASSAGQLGRNAALQTPQPSPLAGLAARVAEANDGELPSSSRFVADGEEPILADPATDADDEGDGNESDDAFNANASGWSAADETPRTEGGATGGGDTFTDGESTGDDSDAEEGSQGTPAVTATPAQEPRGDAETDAVPAAPTRAQQAAPAAAVGDDGVARKLEVAPRPSPRGVRGQKPSRGRGRGRYGVKRPPAGFKTWGAFNASRKAAKAARRGGDEGAAEN